MTAKIMEPIHPGEILLEEFLSPLNISQYKLAKDISVPPRRINEIILGKRSISADNALRLSRYFGLSERFWLNLQSRYDLEIEKEKLHNKAIPLDDKNQASPEMGASPLEVGRKERMFLFELGTLKICYRYFRINTSAICTAFNAAPFLILSATIHMLSPWGTVSSLRILPTKVSSLPAASMARG